VLDGPNQVWVSDLTYLRTLEGYLYLALITDKFSRKIVGYHVGDTLEAVGCVTGAGAGAVGFAGAGPTDSSFRPGQPVLLSSVTSAGCRKQGLRNQR